MAKRLMLLLCLMLFMGMAAASTQRYVFATAAQHQAFTHLTSELRCLVCQNESLADSGAPLAVDLRNQVYQMMRAGQTPVQVKHYLVARYGDFVLFKPRYHLETWLLSIAMA